MKGLTSLVLFLFLASGSAIATDAPEPATTAVPLPPAPVQGSAASTTGAQDASAELAALRTENEKLRTENETLKIAVRGQLKTITALNKQITDLKASNAAAPARSEATAGPNDEIRKAIAEHRLIKGMTLADVKSALSFNPIQTQNSSDGVSIWKASIWDNFPDNHIRVGLGGTEYTIYIRDGVISSWDSVRFFYGPDGRTHNQQ